MSLPAKLSPPPPVNPGEITTGILQANNTQNNMVKLLAGGRKRNRRQRGGADVVEVPKIPVAYNDGGMMQKIYQQNLANSMQSTANAAGDSALVKKGGGSSKRKTKRQRRRKSRRTKKSRKTRR
jgi:hypothetical protein